MKLCVDALMLLAPHTGIGRYVYENSLRLGENNRIDITYYYGYFSKTLLREPCQSPLSRIRNFIVKRPWLKRFVRFLTASAANNATETFDLYWQGNFIPNPGIKASKKVCTIHDFSFEHDPHWHPEERVAYMKRHLHNSAQTCDLILTGSEYTKHEIIERLDVPSEKVRVIYHGVDHEMFRVYEETPLDFALPERFLLFVGSIEPRKNLLLLLQAYSSLKKDFKEDFPLVLIGFKGWENKEVMELIEKESSHIRYLGYLSDRELAFVYNRATIFVFPSLYEGFGLPPLEAMACGTPVIVSNTSSMPEVCGDAAYYVDPKTAANIADGIEKVASDSALQETLRKKGLARAAQFSWERSAKEHGDAFISLTKKLE